MGFGNRTWDRIGFWIGWDWDEIECIMGWDMCA
jgi:hypothetical protein